MFEKGTPEFKKFMEYFGGKKALLAANNSMNRSTFKKIVNAVGVANDKIFMSNNIAEADATLEKQKAEIIVTEYQLGSATTLELLAKHQKLYPNRLNAIFILISDKNSLALSCLAADSGVDAYITKPFTYDKLEQEFIKGVNDKVNPTPYLTKIEEAKINISKENYDEAFKILSEAKTVGSNPCLALYYEALIRYNAKDFKKATDLLQESIFHIPDHYKSLNLLIEIYMKTNKIKDAFTVTQSLLKRYPPHPERIPLYLKTFIACEKYDFIIKFCDNFANYDEDNPNFKTYISAGLAISGKYFANKMDKDRAVVSLQKALDYCEDKPNILMSLATSFMQINEPLEADKVLQKLSESGSSPQYFILDLEIRNKILPPIETFKIGMDLLKKGIKDPKVYEIIIQKSIALGRDESKTRDLIEEATMVHPDQKSNFEKLLEKK